MATPIVILRDSESKPLAWLRERERHVSDNGVVCLHGEVRLVSGWYGDARDEDPPDFDTTTDLNEEFCTFHLKWDGCCHINFAEEGYSHLCGIGCWQTHLLTMQAIWRWAMEQFKGRDDWKDDLVMLNDTKKV